MTTEIQDARPKFGLVHVKRLHTIIPWITHMFMMPDRFMMRREELQMPLVKFGIITDACPWGLGGILVAVDWRNNDLHILEGFETKFTEKEAEFLGLKARPPGSSSNPPGVPPVANQDPRMGHLHPQRQRGSVGNGQEAEQSQADPELPGRRTGAAAGAAEDPASDDATLAGSAERRARPALPTT